MSKLAQRMLDDCCFLIRLSMRVVLLTYSFLPVAYVSDFEFRDHQKFSSAQTATLVSVLREGHLQHIWG